MYILLEINKYMDVFQTQIRFQSSKQVVCSINLDNYDLVTRLASTILNAQYVEARRVRGLSEAFK